MGEETFLSQLKVEITKRGAKWIPASTSISELTLEEKKHRLGLQPTANELQMITKLGLDKAEPIAKKSKSGVSKPIGAVGIPASFDWRNANGLNWTTEIKNQGGCGSCVAFGTIAALEALQKIRTYNSSNKQLDFSEAHLLWCGGGSCNGWYMDQACDYLKNNGVPDEACFPYQAKVMSCADTCSNWQNRIGYTKLKDWTKTKDVNLMKKNIAENGPQITGMAVYDDFFNYSSGVYEHVSGDLAGYHCVAVIGYNDTEGYWIAKNSWGKSWGEEGWFKIAYDECGIQDVFGMWNMNVQSATGSDYAQYVLIDYSCTSNLRVLWAYAGNAWRYKIISDAELSGISKVVMEASKVYVWWENQTITSIRVTK